MLCFISSGECPLSLLSMQSSSCCVPSEWHHDARQIGRDDAVHEEVAGDRDVADEIAKAASPRAPAFGRAKHARGPDRLGKSPYASLCPVEWPVTPAPSIPKPATPKDHPWTAVL